MGQIWRALIKTHHMTSRKKIMTITKAAKRLECAVVLKTGPPPGVMLVEGMEEAVEGWVSVVKVCLLLFLYRYLSWTFWRCRGWYRCRELIDKMEKGADEK